MGAVDFRHRSFIFCFFSRKLHSDGLRNSVDGIFLFFASVAFLAECLIKTIIKIETGDQICAVRVNVGIASELNGSFCFKESAEAWSI